MLRPQRVSLNGTVSSLDLVNVTIIIPPSWANALANSTITGKGYVKVRPPTRTCGYMFIP